MIFYTNDKDEVGYVSVVESRGLLSVTVDCENDKNDKIIYMHLLCLSGSVWCAFFILLYKLFPITRQKITYINFSARQITRAARRNLYIVSLHALLV